jgi:uncharacterized membrane protein
MLLVLVFPSLLFPESKRISPAAKLESDPTAEILRMVGILLALLIGVVAGLRAMTAPAAVSWAASLGWISLGDTWLAFLGYRWTPWIFTILAIGELVTDQLPSTPSRTVPIQFGTRVIIGSLCGAALGMASAGWLLGAVAGAAGAVIGTLSGRAARAKLASVFGRDPPAAILEDGIAIGAAFLIVAATQ